MTAIQDSKAAQKKVSKKKKPYFFPMKHEKQTITLLYIYIYIERERERERESESHGGMNLVAKDNGFGYWSFIHQLQQCSPLAHKCCFWCFLLSFCPTTIHQNLIPTFISESRSLTSK
jgi:hypothetical protein